MRFDGEIEQRDRGLVVQLPFDPEEAFGRVRAPVVVTVNGHFFRTTTMRYGGAVELLRAAVRMPD